MHVLILGGGGTLGPHVVRALEDRHRLRVTDVKPLDSPHEAQLVDVADAAQVRAAAQGTDVIVNCSVSRQDRRLAFGVNTRGTYNALAAAVELGHRCFINTGPLYTLAGPAYRDYDFGLSEEIPPHPGTGLYAMSKSLGQEICRLFADRHPLHVLTMIFSSFCEPEPPPGWNGELSPFAVTLRDAAQAVRCALGVDLAMLPSRCEAFFVTADLPHGQCRFGKAQRLLGWEPRDSLEAWWRGAVT